MIHNAKYIKSIVNPNDIPDDNLPHILFLGRSNVGKSSLINSITNRKNLAITSKTPGRTQTLNLFLIEEKLYLVDAPGYGYARRSKETSFNFLVMIKKFILKNPLLKKIFLLVDFKVGPTKDDLYLYDELKKLPIKLVVIATKYDKVKSSFRLKQEKLIKSNFDDHQLIYFGSSFNKFGIKNIINEVLDIWIKSLFQQILLLI